MRIRTRTSSIVFPQGSFSHFWNSLLDPRGTTVRQLEAYACTGEESHLILVPLFQLSFSGLDLNHQVLIVMDWHNTISGRLSILTQCAPSVLVVSLVSLYSFVATWSLVVDVEPPAVNYTEIDIRIRNTVATFYMTAQALLLMYTRSFARFQSHLEMQRLLHI